MFDVLGRSIQEVITPGYVSLGHKELDYTSSKLTCNAPTAWFAHEQTASVPGLLEMIMCLLQEFDSAEAIKEATHDIQVVCQMASAVDYIAAFTAILCILDNTADMLAPLTASEYLNGHAVVKNGTLTHLGLGKSSLSPFLTSDQFKTSSAGTKAVLAKLTYAEKAMYALNGWCTFSRRHNQLITSCTHLKNHLFASCPPFRTRAPSQAEVAEVPFVNAIQGQRQASTSSGHIEGVPISVLPDTGYQADLMDTDLAKRQGLEAFPNEMINRLANAWRATTPTVCISHAHPQWWLRRCAVNKMYPTVARRRMAHLSMYLPAIHGASTYSAPIRGHASPTAAAPCIIDGAAIGTPSHLLSPFDRLPVLAPRLAMAGSPVSHSSVGYLQTPTAGTVLSPLPLSPWPETSSATSWTSKPAWSYSSSLRFALPKGRYTPELEFYLKEGSCP
ncbi:hypothetical protein BDK51DRAFT_37398 [Blyttiomyces helicus]|uniref:Uncharacterized protein n=1 Tax=Blyttiomyces helicus TaxID=388810 RepID=A0A4P9WLA9_9FUNG|nr:hypothetical protein BDK51DRAFT_37398 [Blyttiomyces helicus]|eukprot:RKO93654.1 hypothetical protein BDK51DRAFT_37398 [Blyttiomyces helicus]